jgi:hypothetical protein
MVTIQELETREKELNDLESQFKSRATQIIPQRRFGAAITSQQQQQVLVDKQQAVASLQQVRAQREQVSTARAELLAQEEAGKNRTAREININAPSRKRQLKEQQHLSKARRAEISSQLKEQGYTAVYREDTLVAVLDTRGNRSIPIQNVVGVAQRDPEQRERLQTAGLITVQETPQGTQTTIVTERERVFQQSLPESERFKSVFVAESGGRSVLLGGSRGRIDAPALGFDRSTQVSVETSQETLASLPTAEEILPGKAGQLLSSSARSQDIFAQFGAGAAFGLISIGKSISNVNQKPPSLPTSKQLLKVALGDYSAEALYFVKYPAFVTGIIASNIGASAAASKLITKSIKPISIKSIPKQELFKSYPSITQIVRGEQIKNVARFDIISAQIPKIEFQVSKLEVPAYISRKQLSSLTLDELKTIFPRGEIVIKGKPSITVASTESFGVTKGGQIVPLKRGKTFVQLGIVRVTPSRIQQFLGKVEGVSYPQDFKLGAIKKQLSKSELKQLATIEQEVSFRGIKIQKPLTNKDIINLAEIEATKIFKLKKGKRGGLIGELIPSGRRTTRGFLLSSQKKIGGFKLEREFGIKEVRIFKERISTIDVTFPKVRAARTSILITGTGKTRLIELPSVTEATPLLKPLTGGRKSSSAFLKQVYGRQFKTAIKATQRVSAGTATAISGLERGQAVSIRTQGIPRGADSLYAGTGLYERTDTELVRIPTQAKTFLFGRTSNQPILSIAQSRISVAQQPLFRQPTALRQPQRNVLRLETRQILRETARESAREALRYGQRNIARQATRQVTRQTTRLTLREVVRSTTIVKIPATKTPSGRFPPLLFPRYPRGKERGRATLGFRTFVIRRGRERFLRGIFSKGIALSRGQSAARRTLAATFGVKPTKVKVRAGALSFAPSKQFRGFRIKQGRAVPLKDIFIQRRGARLSSLGEVREIQQSRRLL